MAFDFNSRNNEEDRIVSHDSQSGFTNIPRERQVQNEQNRLPDRYRPEDNRRRRRRYRRRRNNLTVQLPWKWIIGIILLVIVAGFIWINRALITLYFVRIIVYALVILIFLYLLKKLIFP